ncbi:MBL fold metallo-hydrolase [Geobacter sulfurreducens]|jgi:hydroxyacylglutathione hydrolase|uniref:Zinc-dependent hydrolase YcbL n=1 Tax=Geobacter sulfurreducens (strain ATCC 51573 / DSM 12127 / PCA) TaxID=243231 RepID=Q74E41_GEOSL|nr:MBL fold metallo-hydrolase [Geobacter sulfurreducens]AAR34449.1 zinc-dependent hydrolase YcbL [Geobacter sulfurreducens PCA]ADI83960.1 zinc-dependent hydrolase YcbL [Geobacter sulfurreducens KN400]AJY70844.1 beta-lactamase [Geobacter sulfurreducens]QVW36349.1 MBL fold metallo-hydrolase [Geobacter sulfurreducens]UAC05164.1 MBL fold metallo-hydrolase [Geobacter sulfurreducens]
MIFETVVVGPLGVNCFILGCEQSREGVIVDPGAESGRILERVGELGLKVGMVINTHGHFDHVGGNRKVLEATGAKLLVHRDDVHFLDRAADVAAMYGLDTENSPAPDSLLEDGMTLSVGTLSLRVLHTPGHTPGGCCLLLEGEGKVLTGDTLFEESVGRTDFPGSSHEALITSIREKLLTLPDETEVYPGHGPATSIGRERRYNPYLTD